MTAKTEKKAVDLSSFDDAKAKHEAGIEIAIVGPDGKTPMGFSIRAAGPDSERAQIAQEELADELIEQENLTRLKAREAAQRGIRYLAKLTMGWVPNIILDGQELEFSEENAEKLYRRHRFIREQVDKAAGNRARFTKG
ncbi:hypothetical protein [Nitratireductor sp. GZWM139]|uniref:hypothetical protein n=1 Tax=Nitratireductor sp. GZWM139 TaxID=2950541 RepID=UPI0024BDF5C7|nr:hypothetical protein [Nitratireductor sp. GZWM139]MDJ1465655.1 hypothetical protein [Nitratireductor sp. GZWM139]